MDRQRLLRWAQEQTDWDVVIIGGGATGLGCAVDAAQRGYRTLLVEQHDLAKGTSSRSTKLIHGGLRYLAQGNVRLVREALHERRVLIGNAPLLVRPLEFVIPIYNRWQRFTYGLGLRLYDFLGADHCFARSRWHNADETLQKMPKLNAAGLRGSITYFDGQFDDARLAVALARTAVWLGACVLNYVRARITLNKSGHITGVELEDLEHGQCWQVRCRVIINAAGIFADAVRRQVVTDLPPLLVHSQGTHIVLPARLLGGTSALLIPRTSDHRVMFAIPWYGRLLVGTTDVPVATPDLEPRPYKHEVEYLVDHISQYLAESPTTDDILSVFSGQRALVRRTMQSSTASMARDHVLEVLPQRLVTIVGGKWTTYRRMAQQAVDAAARIAELPHVRCQTQSLPLLGGGNCSSPNDRQQPSQETDASWMPGADARCLKAWTAADPELARPLDSQLPYRAVDVLWSARCELARTVEDVLARRTRALFLDAQAAARAAPSVARILATELHKDAPWQQSQVAQFLELAQNYQVKGMH